VCSVKNIQASFATRWPYQQINQSLEKRGTVPSMRGEKKETPIRQQKSRSPNPFHHNEQNDAGTKIIGIPTPCRNLFQPDSCS